MTPGAVDWGLVCRLDNELLCKQLNSDLGRVCLANQILESFEFNFENQQTVDLPQRDGFNIYGFLKGSSIMELFSSNIRIENENNRHLLISIKIQNK